MQHVETNDLNNPNQEPPETKHYGVTFKTHDKKLRKQESEKPRNQETQKPRNRGTKKPRDPETKKPRNRGNRKLEPWRVAKWTQRLHALNLDTK